MFLLISFIVYFKIIILYLGCNYFDDVLKNNYINNLMKKFSSNKYINFLYSGFTRSAPVQLTLFVTSRCNIRCKMCFYWEPVENKSTHEITLEEVDKISKSMPNFFWLLISGGEALVRKDLPEIVETF